MVMRDQAETAEDQFCWPVGGSLVCQEQFEALAPSPSPPALVMVGCQSDRAGGLVGAAPSVQRNLTIETAQGPSSLCSTCLGTPGQMQRGPIFVTVYK